MPVMHFSISAGVERSLHARESEDVEMQIGEFVDGLPTSIYTVVV
jgi:hypothetical protein